MSEEIIPAPPFPECPFCKGSNWEVLSEPMWDHLAGFSLFVYKGCEDCDKNWTEVYTHNNTFLNWKFKYCADDGTDIRKGDEEE